MFANTIGAGLGARSGNDIIPIPGTKKRKYLEENVGAIEVQLSDSDLNAIEEILRKYPNVGARYSDGAMALVNN
ncbi:hypothetical protein KUH03_35150 [Sphingobacterium sp. E70]|uniref:aldo/keto reductase n=1 Tax=Sphingobacterium sp. E70 TaxID=2853439 RepID=UPI00211C5F7A|nr:aldo/keto reductase [Sphingobacterium sp. E70]ULT24214.1 hypothetical protein KUH03_35150 [Sphingobacterium sp. E70]